MRFWCLIVCLFLPAAVSAGPDDLQQSQQHYLSGMIYFQRGEYTKAREEWWVAEQLDPSNADAKAGLERIARLFGESDVKPAKSKKRAVTAEAKEQSQQHYLSGMIYYQKQEFEKARAEWTLAKKLDPANGDAARGLERLDQLFNDSPSSGVAPSPALRWLIDNPPEPGPDRVASPAPRAAQFPEKKGPSKELGVLDNDSSK